MNSFRRRLYYRVLGGEVHVKHAGREGNQFGRDACMENLDCFSTVAGGTLTCILV